MQLARQHRERALAGIVTPIRIREEPLFILGYCAMYRACPTRARWVWGQSDRSVAHHTECFLGGATTIGTCRGGHSADRFHATGCRSPYSSFLRTEGSILINGLRGLGSH